jgi:hypothetical protein
MTHNFARAQIVKLLNTRSTTTCNNWQNYISIFTFLYTRQEVKKVCTAWLQASPEFKSKGKGKVVQVL